MVGKAILCMLVVALLVILVGCTFKVIEGYELNQLWGVRELIVTADVSGVAW